jgi:hypothetical protein
MEHLQSTNHRRFCPETLAFNSCNAIILFWNNKHIMSPLSCPRHFKYTVIGVFGIGWGLQRSDCRELATVVFFMLGVRVNITFYGRQTTELSNLQPYFTHYPGIPGRHFFCKLECPN